MVSVGVVVGTLWGRRERGSKAASPSALYRARSSKSQDSETPYWAATSRTGRFSTTTEVISNRLSVMPGRWNLADAQSGMTRDISPGCLETWLRCVLNQHTAPATKYNRRSEPGSWVTTGPVLAFGVSEDCLRTLPRIGPRVGVEA